MTFYTEVDIDLIEVDIDLEEFDHSLFYMSEDDFSKLLEIIEYHKGHRNAS